MRIGCLGCFTWLLIGGITLGFVAGTYWLISGALYEPPPAGGSAPGPARVAELALEQALRVHRAPQDRRGTGAPPAPTTVILKEADLAGFLAKHLPSVAETPLAVKRLALRLGRAELLLQLPARAVVGSWLPGFVEALLPRTWPHRPLWLRVEGTIRVESGGVTGRRYLRTELTSLWVGQRRLPTATLYLVLDPAGLGLLQWPLPPRIDDVRIEPGRVLITVGTPR